MTLSPIRSSYSRSVIARGNSGLGWVAWKRGPRPLAERGSHFLSSFHGGLCRRIGAF